MSSYKRLDEDVEPGPPKPNRVLACLTSGWVRLIVLIWAACMLTTVAVTWYDVTAYHLVGSSVQDDKGAWGQVYDSTRSASKVGLGVTGVIADVAQGKGAKPRLKDEDFDIVDDDFEKPKGWQAIVIHAWMVIVTVVNASLALLTWFVVALNILVTVCGITRLHADPEKREHRQELACDVALAWQLLVPFVCWVIQKLTGYKDLGIAPHLYHRMDSIGPMVLMGQKMLVLLMTTLKDAQKALNTSGDVAWALCTRDVADKTREVKRSAIDVFEKSSILNKGPLWLQRACQGGLVAAHFEARPYGVVLGILGLVDRVIIHRLTGAILGVIPSWIDETINKIEEKLATIGEDAKRLSKELDEHLKRIKEIIEKVSKTLDEGLDHLQHARALVAKHADIFGESMTLQMERVINNVSTPLAEILKDVDFAVSEIKKVEDTIEKETSAVLGTVLDKIKGLTRVIDAFRPENILIRLENLADEALYGELIDSMAKHKAAGASPLEFSLGV